MRLASGTRATERQTRRRRVARIALALVALAWVATTAAPARADAPYDSRRAGNPVRIAAYGLHPFGVLLDYLIFRPAWWIGQHEPFKTLFGVED